MKKNLFILEDDFEDFNSLINQLDVYNCLDEDGVYLILESILKEGKDMTEELIKYDYFIIDIGLNLDYGKISGLDFIKKNLYTFFNNDNKKIIIFSDRHERDVIKKDNENKLLDYNNIFFIEKETNEDGFLTNDIINRIKLKLDE